MFIMNSNSPWTSKINALYDTTLFWFKILRTLAGSSRSGLPISMMITAKSAVQNASTKLHNLHRHIHPYNVIGAINRVVHFAISFSHFPMDQWYFHFRYTCPWTPFRNAVLKQNAWLAIYTILWLMQNTTIVITNYSLDCHSEGQIIAHTNVRVRTPLLVIIPQRQVYGVKINCNTTAYVHISSVYRYQL
jgi:hypothetical protein